jgi:hypothetical protein
MITHPSSVAGQNQIALWSTLISTRAVGCLRHEGGRIATSTGVRKWIVSSQELLSMLSVRTLHIHSSKGYYPEMYPFFCSQITLKHSALPQIPWLRKQRHSIIIIPTSTYSTCSREQPVKLPLIRAGMPKSQLFEGHQCGALPKTELV